MFCREKKKVIYKFSELDKFKNTRNFLNFDFINLLLDFFYQSLNFLQNCLLTFFM